MVSDVMRAKNFPIDENYKPTGPRGLTSPTKNTKKNHTKAFHKLIKNKTKHW